MGRTMQSITESLAEQEAAFSRFRRALRRTDQLVLDDLFVAAKKHTAEAAYSANLLPMETFLVAMLLEEHKTVQSLRRRIEALEDKAELVAAPQLLSEASGGRLRRLRRRRGAGAQKSRAWKTARITACT